MPIHTDKVHTIKGHQRRKSNKWIDIIAILSMPGGYITILWIAHFTGPTHVEKEPLKGILFSLVYVAYFVTIAIRWYRGKGMVLFSIGLGLMTISTILAFALIISGGLGLRAGQSHVA